MFNQEIAYLFSLIELFMFLMIMNKGGTSKSAYTALDRAIKYLMQALVIVPFLCSRFLIPF